MSESVCRDDRGGAEPELCRRRRRLRSTGQLEPAGSYLRQASRRKNLARVIVERGLVDGNARGEGVRAMAQPEALHTSVFGDQQRHNAVRGDVPRWRPGAASEDSNALDA